MAYTAIDRVYSIFIDVMTGVSSGSGSATFYNTDSHTSYIELTVTNGNQSFDMTEYNYVLVVSKPSKQTYKNEYTTTDKSKLVIALDSQMLADSGSNKGQLFIMKTVDTVNKVLTMVEFNYLVKDSSYNELAPESTDHDALYIKLRNDVDSILSKIENGEIGGAGMTATQKEQLTTAYNHAMSDAVTTTDEVNSVVASYVEANKDALKGDKGDKGEAGVNGKDGLTTAVSVNSKTYTQTNGTITLPNYPTVPTKTSQLTNDSGFLNADSTIDADSLNGKKFSEPMTKQEYDNITEKDANTIYLVDDDSSVIGVPNYSVSDANKVLAVNANGKGIGWVKASIGGDSGSSDDYDTEVSLPYTALSGSTDILLVFNIGTAQLTDISEIGGVELSDWTDTTYSSYTDHSIEVVTKDDKTCIKAIYNSKGGYTSGYHTLTSVNTSGNTFDSTHTYFFYAEIFVESVLGTNSKIFPSLSTYTTAKPTLSTSNRSSWQVLAGIGSPASYTTGTVELKIQNDGVMYIAYPTFVDLTVNELETKSFDELKAMAAKGEFNASANANSFSATITNGSETINVAPFTEGTHTQYVTVASGSTLSISKYLDYSLAKVSAYAKTGGDSTITLEDYQWIVNTRFKGATVVFEGDSITDSNFSESYNGKSWADYLAIKLAFGKIVNPSLGGSTISNTHVNENGQIITRITNTNYPSDTKLFFLFAGTNDWNNNVELGTVDSTDSSTILGALNNCISTIQSKLPEATIVVMTPMHRSGMRTAKRTAGTLSEVAIAYEKVCERWGVDCINTLKTFGINAYNPSVASMYYIEKEGQLHPSPLGHKRIAVRMGGICSTL